MTASYMSIINAHDNKHVYKTVFVLKSDKDNTIIKMYD